jgi:hypothetical protein
MEPSPISTQPIRSKANWCIVVADDYGPDARGRKRSEIDQAPVHFRNLGASGTLLQRALHRALSIAPATQVLLTADEECRELWETSLWPIRPAKRFIGANRRGAVLTAAAAALYVAQRSPAAVITILPARSYVAHEAILRRALGRALEELPRVPEGVLTLGMLDMENSWDEDYLALERPAMGETSLVKGVARRPVSLAAQSLRRQGALVASGILIGYAGALIAPLMKHWRGVPSKLRELTARPTDECAVPLELTQELPCGVFRYHPWHPAAVAQRVLPVCRSGFSSLKSPQSIERILTFISAMRAVQGGNVTQGEVAPMALVPRASPQAVS